jgi:hypothetical protein
MQYVIRSPKTLVEAIDSYVDGERWRSRNQMINIILADWIARERHPIDPYHQPRQQEYQIDIPPEIIERLEHHINGTDLRTYNDVINRILTAFCYEESKKR